MSLRRLDTMDMLVQSLKEMLRAELAALQSSWVALGLALDTTPPEITLGQPGRPKHTILCTQSVRSR